MLTPSLLLQAFQLPPSLKGSESEQETQPGADSASAAPTPGREGMREQRSTSGAQRAP